MLSDLGNTMNIASGLKNSFNLNGLVYFLQWFIIFDFFSQIGYFYMPGDLGGLKTKDKYKSKC